VLISCDQIVDRSLGKISKTKTNESLLTNKESSLKTLDNSDKENNMNKPEKEKKLIEENLSNENSKELIKKYDVIGTNKDGPYRTGETNRLRSTK